MAAQSQPSEPERGSVALLLTTTHVRLVLAGELDLSTKAELLEAVREAARHDRPVEVDTRHVTFMDSSAIATLSRLVQLTDHRPVFLSPSDVVRFLLDVTRVGELVEIVDGDGHVDGDGDGDGHGHGHGYSHVDGDGDGHGHGHGERPASVAGEPAPTSA